MNRFRETILPILIATVWISISEFIRNEFLLKSHWSEHYANMGLVFPSEPINGAIWGLWSLCFAVAIYFIAQKFSLLQTTLISWWVGFVLMWLVTGNMDVLPLGILAYAVPLSLLECYLAALIIKKLQKMN